MSAAALRNRSAEPTPHLLTTGDVWAMVQAGVIEEGAKVELIEGVLYDMPADGEENLDWAARIGRWLYRSIGETHGIIPGMNLFLSDISAPKPDWWVFPRAMRPAQVRGPDVLLAIEQSWSTLRYDLGEKADLYARHGVREYWVIDLNEPRVLVHRDPVAGRYPEPTPYLAEEAVDALRVPGLRLRLSDLSQS